MAAGNGSQAKMTPKAVLPLGLIQVRCLWSLPSFIGWSTQPAGTGQVASITSNRRAGDSPRAVSAASAVVSFARRAAWGESESSAEEDELLRDEEQPPA